MNSHDVKFAFLIAGSLAVSPGFGAEPRTEHTFQLEDGEKRPAATLEAAAFLVGRWTGSAFGERMEESWSAPTGGSMVPLGPTSTIRPSRTTIVASSMTGPPLPSMSRPPINASSDPDCAHNPAPAAGAVGSAVPWPANRRATTSRHHERRTGAVIDPPNRRGYSV